jgi:hypothetical protein
MTLFQILRELQIALAVILGRLPCMPPARHPGRLAAFQLVSLAGQQAIVQVPVTRQRGPRSAGGGRRAGYPRSLGARRLAGGLILTMQRRRHRA